MADCGQSAKGGPTSENLRKTSVQLWVNLGSPRKTSKIFLFSRCKVKVNIGSSEPIWAYGGRFDGPGGGVIAFFLGGGDGVILCRLVIKEKSPDFGSPDIGISVYCTHPEKTSVMKDSSLSLRS